MFRVSAAGVQRDAVISNDTFEDRAWDAVWSRRSAWTSRAGRPRCAFRSRSSASPPRTQQTWGINVARFMRRKNETSWLELVPKNENGLASRMVDLTGLDGIRPRAASGAAAVRGRCAQEYIEPRAPGNPFNDGSRLFGSAGLDMKTGLTSDLTLGATINPDFGQVEVDPAVVNLTAFETFFEEKRPFFIEGCADLQQLRHAAARTTTAGSTTRTRSSSIRAASGVRRSSRRRRLRGCADRHHHPWRREAHWQDGGRLEHRAARGGHRPASTRRRITGSVRGTTRSGAADELLRRRACSTISAAAASGVLATVGSSRSLDTPLLEGRCLTSRATVFGGDAFYFFDRKHEWVVTGEAVRQPGERERERR